MARTNACFIVGFYSARPPTRPNKSQTVKRAAALQLLKLSFASSLRSGKHFHLLRDRPGKFTRPLFLCPLFNFSRSERALRNWYALVFMRRLPRAFCLSPQHQHQQRINLREGNVMIAIFTSLAGCFALRLVFRLASACFFYERGCLFSRQLGSRRLFIKR